MKKYQQYLFLKEGEREKLNIQISTRRNFVTYKEQVLLVLDIGTSLWYLFENHIFLILHN